MNIKTHREIHQALCGTPHTLSDGYSEVSLTTITEMSVDNKGLVHGGFIFGLADYAAMIAVNDPNVVLGAANVKFLKPVKTGETVRAIARVEQNTGKKRSVSVTVTHNDTPVFEGEFACFVLDRHVLDPNVAG